MVKTVKKSESFDLRMMFNDLCLRELDLDYTEENYIYDIESDSILQIKDKFIRYIDIEGVIPKGNEIELNLLENARLMETISLKFLDRWAGTHGYVIEVLSQDKLPNTSKGVFTITYNDNNTVKQISSNPYYNESVRIIDIICGINGTSHLYDLDEFDVSIERDK